MPSLSAFSMFSSLCVLGFFLGTEAVSIPYSARLHRRFTLVAQAPPANWSTNSLEDYDQYHFRFLSIGCHQKKDQKTFYEQCCHPRLKGEKLEKIPVECHLDPQSMINAHEYILKSTSNKGEIKAGEGKKVYVTKDSIKVLKPETGRNASEPPSQNQLIQILTTQCQIQKINQLLNLTSTAKVNSTSSLKLNFNCSSLPESSKLFSNASLVTQVFQYNNQSQRYTDDGLNSNSPSDAIPAAQADVDATFKSKVQADVDAAAKVQTQSDADAAFRAKAQSDADVAAKVKVQFDADAAAKAKAQADADAATAAKLKAQSDADAAAKTKAQSDADAAAKAKAQSDADAAAKAKAQSDADAAAKAKAQSDADAAAKAKSEAHSSTSSSSYSASFSGSLSTYGQDGGAKGTFFYQGGAAGACGNVNADSVALVALPTALYDGGKHCGKSVRIKNTANGKQVVATVQDMCPGCPSDTSLDLSTGAYDSIGDQATGVLPIEWSFI